MKSLRATMDAALNLILVSALRKAGFKGSLPHFRRRSEIGIDLLTIQYDKSGGGFLIEIARCGLAGVMTHWGKEIPASEVTAQDLHPNERRRVKQQDGSGTDSWFRFDDGDCERCARHALEKLREAEPEWVDHE